MFSAEGKSLKFRHVLAQRRYELPRVTLKLGGGDKKDMV